MPIKIARYAMQWWLPLLLASLFGVNQWLIPREWLQYDRAQLFQGEWWRALTGHSIHLDWQHYLLNLSALFIIWAMCFVDRKTNAVLIRLFVISIGVSLGLFLLSPQIEWYVGFSGVLYGLLTIGLIESPHHARWVKSLLLTALFAKVVYEQLIGEMSLLAGEFAVVVDAHLYGTAMGLALAIPLMVRYVRQQLNPTKTEAPH